MTAPKDPGLPDNGLTALEAKAIEFFEWYQALLRAGFEWNDALILVGKRAEEFFQDADDERGTQSWQD